MPQSPIQILAELSCKPGSEERLEQQGRAFVTRIRSQPGCLGATLHRVEEEARYVFQAEFAHEQALEAHLASEWRQGALSALPDLLASWPRRFTMRRVA